MMPWTSPLTAGMDRQATSVATAVPVLRTARLTLRAPRLGDFPAYAAIASSDRGVHVGGPLTETEAWDDFCRMTANWLLRGHGVWAIETHAGDTVGFVLIGFEPGDADPELGWFLIESAEGQGYASEAAMAVHHHAFARLGLDRLVSYIAPENAASARVAARLGARPEGDLDGSQVWVHRPVARPGMHTHAHTDCIPNTDAFQTSKRGA
jgi:RimJ/RimL family protein N-acetyltransferase